MLANRTGSVAPLRARSFAVCNWELMSRFCCRDHSASSWVLTYSAHCLIAARRLAAFRSWSSDAFEFGIILLDLQCPYILFEALAI